MRRIYPKGSEEYDGKGNTYRVEEHKDGDALFVSVDLVYPSYDPRKSLVQIGIEHTRAVDNFRVWFDLKRNCWIVEMKPILEVDGGDEVVGDWREVTTIPAWMTGEPGETCPHPRWVEPGGCDYKYCEVCGLVEEDGQE